MGEFYNWKACLGWQHLVESKNIHGWCRDLVHGHTLSRNHDFVGIHGTHRLLLHVAHSWITTSRWPQSKIASSRTSPYFSINLSSYINFTCEEKKANETSNYLLLCHREMIFDYIYSGFQVIFGRIFGCTLSNKFA